MSRQSDQNITVIFGVHALVYTLFYMLFLLLGSNDDVLRSLPMLRV